MDDTELKRIASNNPAMTAPASSEQFPHAQGLSTTRSQQSCIQPLNCGHGDSTTTTLYSDPAAHTAPPNLDLPHTQTNHDSLFNNNVKSQHHGGGEEQNKQRQRPPSPTPLPPQIFLSKCDRGWRRVVRNFSPSWFSTTMGTGIVSLLLITIPFQSDWLYWLSVVFFVFNTVLFTGAFTISILRYTLYPAIWRVMINDPTNSLFLGTVPMGFATLIESWIFLCIPYWGEWSIFVAWAMWMLDAVAAVGVTVSLMFLLISESHLQQLDRITAAQLLPIAATIVAAGTGVEVAEALSRSGHHQYALGTLLTGYIMWGMATPFSLTVLVMYYQRLALHKLPPREIIVSSFLPLGPLGMGGYTIFYAGKVACDVLPHVSILKHITLAPEMLYMMGLLTALVMWGFGLVWLCFALATIWSCRPFPFNMGWWGFTFPLGVFAISTMTFGVELPSLFFRVLGTIFGVAVILLWCVVAAGTAKGAWNGQLFYAPCVKSLEQQQQQQQLELQLRAKYLSSSNDVNGFGDVEAQLNMDVEAVEPR